MAQSLLFFAGISNIGLPNSVASGVRYSDKYVITSDRERIKRTVLPFYQAIGSVEGDYLVQEAPGIIFRRDEWDGSSTDIRSTLETRIVEDLIVVQGLLLSLWLTKDNAATVDNAWIFAMDGRKFNVHTSSWAVRPSCSNGRFDQVEFSSEDFRVARMSTNLQFDTGGYISGKSHPTLLVANSQRFQRFLYLVGGARATADVAIKLALYCSALEAFVSTAQAELSHQVSERVASLLSPPGLRRLEIFGLMKEAYGYRSKAVHGATFKGATFDRLREVATRVDGICREISALYINAESGVAALIEGDSDHLNSRFAGMILGHS